MKSRLLVSAIGVPVLLYVVLWAPKPVMAVALMVLAGIAAGELMQCVKVPAGGAMELTTIFMAVCTVGLVWRHPQLLELGWLLYLLLACAYAVWKGGEEKFHQLMAGAVAALFVPYALSAFLRLDAADFHRGYLLLPFVFSFMSDTGGYFFGRAFGRHKLAPHVSPKKTVEGSIGGLLGNALGGVVFALAMNTWGGESIDYLGVVVLGLFCSVLAQLGDLTFSLIKREFGIKDYGKIFLEHGGVLDRFDSVIFVAPALSALLPMMN